MRPPAARSEPLTLLAELRTAGWVGVLYGQPVNAESGERLAAVLEAVGELFPAAHVQSYRFIHQYGKQDHLCLFFVDSFSAVAFTALRHYAMQAFGDSDEFVKTSVIGSHETRWASRPDDCSAPTTESLVR